jgi:hypothetical protein
MIKQANQCGGKQKYDSKEKANIQVALLNKKGGAKVRTYLCKLCNGYHFGHESKSTKMENNKKKYKMNVDHVSKTHKVENRFK